MYIKAIKKWERYEMKDKRELDSTRLINDVQCTDICAQATYCVYYPPQPKTQYNNEKPEWIPNYLFSILPTKSYFRSVEQ